VLKLNVDNTWVKASLHCHSTASDGKLEPREVVHYYLSRGYGLITITDHDKITTGYDDFPKGMFLPGVEIPKGKTKLGADYHIIAIGVDDPTIVGLQSPSEVIDEVNAAGGVAIIAHPYWSGLVYEDLIALKGYIGIEIYNTGCDVEVAKGYSTVHWDSLISSGIKAWGFAVDDAHRYSTPPIDADGGWIWVKVADKNQEAVIDSLKKGCFYSSTGPSIKKLEMSENSVHVELTPVTRVNLVSRNGRGLSIEISQLKNLVEKWKKQSERRYLELKFDNLETVEKKGLTKVFLTSKDLKAETAFDRKGLRLLDIKAKSGYDYQRLEAIDQYGKTAWSNPLFSNKEPQKTMGE
jgi:hypothetical protein